MSIIDTTKQKLGHGIGASQVAAALGVSPWTSPLKLWLLLTGRAQDNVTSEAAEWGQILEPVVRGYYAARHGHTGEHSRIVVPSESMRHSTIPWLRATPDGLVEIDHPIAGDPKSFIERGLEVKCPSWRTAWQWGNQKDRTVPPHHRVQSVVQMAVAELPRVDFAVLLGGCDYFEVTVDRDLELEEQVLDGVREFWRLVEADTPPEVNHSHDWRSYFADRLPTERVDVDTPDIDPLMSEWLRSHVALKEALKADDLAKNRILKLAVDNGANRLNTEHGRVTVRRSKTGNLFLVAPETWGQE